MRLLEVLRVFLSVSLPGGEYCLGTLGEDLSINDFQVVIGTRLSRERFGKKEQEREQELVFIKITWCL